MFKGFFNRMYNGNPNRPDLEPGDMPKNRFELFFTTLGIRFGDLIKLNLLFVVFLLPVLVWSLLWLSVLNSTMGAAMKDAALAATLDNDLFWQTMFYLAGNLLFLPLAGPPIAGMTYVARNYARDEHAWLWSDFKEHMRKNWKQSAVLMLILAVVLLLAFYTNGLYSQLGRVSGQDWMWIMQMVFVVFVSVFVASYLYAFPMLVTYKLKIGQIIRNSLMLSLGRLPFTILFTILALLPLGLGLGLSLATPYALLGLVIYYLLIGFSLTAFILNSYTNATFDRLMRSDDSSAGSHPLDPEDREVKP